MGDRNILPVPTPDAAAGEPPAFLPRSIVDPKGGRQLSRGRNVLVLTTIEDAGERLGGYTTPADTVKVVVPAVRQSFLDWLANDQKAFTHAEAVAAATAAELPGTTIRSGAGEADVTLAIHDALATFPADEIIVAVRSDDDAGIVESMAKSDAPPKTIGGVPVRCLVVSEA